MSSQPQIIDPQPKTDSLTKGPHFAKNKVRKKSSTRRHNSLPDPNGESDANGEATFLALVKKDSQKFIPHALSLAVHILVLLILAFTFFQSYQPASILINASNESGHSLDDLEELDLETPTESDTETEEETAKITEVQEAVAELATDNSLTEASLDTLDIPDDLVEGEFGIPSGGIESDSVVPGSITKLSKAQLARRFGGSLGSERAVQDALKWLAAHQLPDGSWRMAHSKCPSCNGKCSNDGLAKAPTAATAFGLLPFLAAGHHHQTAGPYKEIVRKGLGFLTNQVKKNRYGADFRSPVTSSKDTGGSMYAHGLATLALSEAYSLTKDARLKPFVTSAVRFIENTQGTVGGWSYFGNPKTESTTISITGWQVVALYSAEKAGIRTNPKTWKGIVNYMKLNRRFSNGKRNGRYGYRHNGIDGDRTAAQPIGMLTELFLTRGSYGRDFELRMKELIDAGPRQKMAYYNYYAHQLVFHYTGGQGKHWKTWNQKMLNIVVPNQDKEGHSAGSWFQKGAPAFLRNGGRMMDTSLNTLILTVYFRHLPMFSGGAIRGENIDEFDLNR